MNTEESQLALFARELEKLAIKYPSLYFEDRCNPDHVKAYDQEGRPAKLGKGDDMRFQAWRPVLEHVEKLPVPYKSGGVSETVRFRHLVAWADTTARLAEILAEKGVR